MKMRDVLSLFLAIGITSWLLLLSWEEAHKFEHRLSGQHRAVGATGDRSDGLVLPVFEPNTTSEDTIIEADQSEEHFSQEGTLPAQLSQPTDSLSDDSFPSANGDSVRNESREFEPSTTHKAILGDAEHDADSGSELAESAGLAEGEGTEDETGHGVDKPRLDGIGRRSLDDSLDDPAAVEADSKLVGNASFDRPDGKYQPAFRFEGTEYAGVLAGDSLLVVQLNDVFFEVHGDSFSAVSPLTELPVGYTDFGLPAAPDIASRAMAALEGHLGDVAIPQNASWVFWLVSEETLRTVSNSQRAVASRDGRDFEEIQFTVGKLSRDRGGLSYAISRVAYREE